LKAVIIAAGNGTRLQPLTKDRPKPLVPLLGVPILERIIKSAKKAGIKEYIIITGYMGEKIRKYFGNGEKLNVRIEYVHNKNYNKENGLSALKAKEILKDINEEERFLLLMSDHIFDHRIIQKLIQMQVKIPNGRPSVILAVDRRQGTDDDTKVLEKDNKIVNIGKQLKDYNCIDTGIFLCTKKLFDYLQQAIDNGEHKLAQAILRAAQNQDAWVMDIKKIDTYDSKLRKDVDAWWCDIDSLEDYKKAKKIIVENASKNPSDLLATYVHKPIENKLVSWIAKYKITPNQVTTIVNILAYSVTILYLLGYFLPGIILAFIVGIVDGLDGKLARVKMQTSRVGSLEHAFDLLFEFSWIVALGFRLYYVTGDGFPLLYAALTVMLVAFYRAIYDQFRKGAGISLDVSGKFESIFRRFAGRRNLYNIPILIFVLLGIPYYALVVILIHAAITAFVYASRAIHHLKILDKNS